jgi:hypothetical protein
MGQAAAALAAKQPLGAPAAGCGTDVGVLCQPASQEVSMHEHIMLECNPSQSQYWLRSDSIAS